MGKLNFRKNSVVLMVAVSIAAFISSCGETTDKMVKGKTYKTQGWMDDDTFRVTALGAPSPNAQGMVKRKTQAREAALTMAQKLVVEKMIGAEIKGASAVKDGESAGVVVTKEFQGMIKGGSIVEETFDEEDNCEVVYEIHAKGLKKKAQLEIDRIKEK
ncbi:MAG: hypothetical protein OEV78_05150 [Spirochaetia bacterium]|nr:hypothetical protein [Spirochaetia bacterium]